MQEQHHASRPGEKSIKALFGDRQPSDFSLDIRESNIPSARTEVTIQTHNYNSHNDGGRRDSVDRSLQVSTEMKTRAVDRATPIDSPKNVAAQLHILLRPMVKGWIKRLWVWSLTVVIIVFAITFLAAFAATLANEHHGGVQLFSDMEAAQVSALDMLFRHRARRRGLSTAATRFYDHVVIMNETVDCYQEIGQQLADDFTWSTCGKQCTHQHYIAQQPLLLATAKRLLEDHLALKNSYVQILQESLDGDALVSELWNHFLQQRQAIFNPSAGFSISRSHVLQRVWSSMASNLCRGRLSLDGLAFTVRFRRHKGATSVVVDLPVISSSNVIFWAFRPLLTVDVSVLEARLFLDLLFSIRDLAVKPYQFALHSLEGSPQSHRQSLHDAVRIIQASFGGNLTEFPYPQWAVRWIANLSANQVGFVVDEEIHQHLYESMLHLASGPKFKRVQKRIEEVTEPCSHNPVTADFVRTWKEKLEHDLRRIDEWNTVGEALAKCVDEVELRLTSVVTQLHSYVVVEGSSSERFSTTRFAKMTFKLLTQLSEVMLPLSE